MTKNQLIQIVAKKANMPKNAAKQAVNTILDEITSELGDGNKVVLSGFGTFRTRRVKDKPVIVPVTKQRMIVPAHTAARFSPGKTLKRTVK